MKKMTVLNLCICGVMIALHVILELFCTIRIGNDIKITFAMLPIIFIAILCGSIEGLSVGLLGTLLSQLLTFGWTQSTIFWILPGALCGLAAGLFLKIFNKKISLKSVSVSIGLAMLVYVLFNLVASYFDGVIIYKYMTVHALLVLIPVRVLIATIQTVIYVAVCLPLCKALRPKMYN